MPSKTLIRRLPVVLVAAGLVVAGEGFAAAPPGAERRADPGTHLRRDVRDGEQNRHTERNARRDTNRYQHDRTRDRRDFDRHRRVPDRERRDYIRRHPEPRPVYPARPWVPRDHYYPYPRYYRPRRPILHFHSHGDDFFGWLAFTVITLAIIDSLNEEQQRQHEASTRYALRAPVGESVRWSDGGAGGAVVTTREGVSSQGRYCREYRQEVTVGGKSEEAYGTACRNADGSWEIIQ